MALYCIKKIYLSIAHKHFSLFTNWWRKQTIKNPPYTPPQESTLEDLSNRVGMKIKQSIN
jgi:hypothetical protein